MSREPITKQRPLLASLDAAADTIQANPRHFDGVAWIGDTGLDIGEGAVRLGTSTEQLDNDLSDPVWDGGLDELETRSCR